mgnify:CR=1 FL=1
MSICTAAQAVKRMEYYIGYYEKSSSKYVTRNDTGVFTLDKGSGNYTYFGNVCGINPGAWCAMLISTAIYEACGDSKADAKTVLWGVWPYAACNQLYDAAPSGAKGRRGSWTPKAGDVIVFTYDGSTRNHTGMVYKTDSTTVYTIEGNSGDKCQKKSYKLTDSTIYGYVRPKYADAATATTKEKCTVSTYVIKKGSVGMGVIAVQAALNALGFSCGKADGEFGADTEKAVKSFQKTNGLTADGEVGTKTLEKLLYTQ